MCVQGCSFESERAKRAAPAAPINQWKAPFSTALITVSAALLGSDRPVSTQPTKSSHTQPPFLCHRHAWSPISRRATLHRSPISYSKGGRYGSPPLPLPPLLVRCPAFIDHKSTSVAELIVNHPQWHYWSDRSLSYRPALSPRPTSQPDCGVLIPLRYSIEGSLLIIHLLCCNFIFFPVHTVVTGSPYGGNLVNKRTAFCAPRHAGLTDVALSYSWLVAYFFRLCSNVITNLQSVVAYRLDNPV